MIYSKASRRTFITMAMGAIGLGADVASATDGGCADLDKLAGTGLRRSLNFRSVSSNPARVCGGCTFFKAGQGSCGACVLLSGGPVAANSVCDSWAAKAG